MKTTLTQSKPAKLSLADHLVAQAKSGRAFTPCYTMEEREKLPGHLFTTDPHGAQSVSRPPTDNEGLAAHEGIFSIVDESGNAIGFTDEELDSLARQWLRFRGLKSLSISGGVTETQWRDLTAPQTKPFAS